MKSKRSLPRRALVLLGTALIASGLVVAGIAAYKVVDPQAPARQQALQQQLVTGWQAAPRPAAPRPTASSPPSSRSGPARRSPCCGSPRWAGTGSSRSWREPRWPSCRPVLVTSPAPSCPARPGNFAVAAHDITAGNPFLHLKLTDRRATRVVRYYAARDLQYRGHRREGRPEHEVSVWPRCPARRQTRHQHRHHADLLHAGALAFTP